MNDEKSRVADWMTEKYAQKSLACLEYLAYLGYLLHNFTNWALFLVIIICIYKLYINDRLIYCMYNIMYCKNTFDIKHETQLDVNIY